MNVTSVGRRVQTLGLTFTLLTLGGCLHKGAPAQMDLYLLMGQSNMSGRGLMSDAPTDPAEARVLVYGNDGVWRPAAEPLDSATNQIDAVSADPAAGVGPGLPFARTLLGSRPHRRIGLIPCAKGGTSITQWGRATSRTSLYGSCLARAREAGTRGRLAGILWYQGESDADTQADADAWAARFTVMIDGFRADLGRPRLPLVVVGLGDRPRSGPYGHRFGAWETVQSAQASLRLSNQARVSAAGLARNVDELHLSSEGQSILGARLAVAMDSLDSEPR